MNARYTLTLLVLPGILVACSTDAPTATSRRPAYPKSWASLEISQATFTSFDVPGSGGTLALDINSSGTIVGRYFIGNNITHGFIRTPGGEISTIDYPGSSFTVAASINARGDIVGMYALPSAPRARHGYLLRDGVFTSFDPPGSIFTNALGINDRGDIVGRFCVGPVCLPPGNGGPNGTYHGFTMRDGVITQFDFPGSVETNGFKSSSSGLIVGGYGMGAGQEEHLFTMSDGEFTQLDLPISNAVSQDNGGINARGDVVGVYCDGAPPCLIVPTGTHGFVTGKDGFATIDYPGASATSTIGVNSRGDIVGGWWDAAAHIHGFVLSR